MWAQSSLTESYWGIRGVEGHFKDIVEPPAIILGVNMGSPVPREGKNSGVLETVVRQTDRQTNISG